MARSSESTFVSQGFLRQPFGSRLASFWLVHNLEESFLFFLRGDRLTHFCVLWGDRLQEDGSYPLWINNAPPTEAIEIPLRSITCLKPSDINQMLAAGFCATNVDAEYNCNPTRLTISVQTALSLAKIRQSEQVANCCGHQCAFPPWPRSS